MSDSFPLPFNRPLTQRLRSWFFTGLVVFGPVAVTVYIAWWAIDTVDNWVRPWFPLSLSPDGYLPFHVPGFGVVIAIVGLGRDRRGGPAGGQADDFGLHALHAQSHHRILLLHRGQRGRRTAGFRR